MEQKEVFAKVGELIENCGHIAKLFIKSDICMANGDLPGTQKNVMEGQNLLKVMMNDVFVEVAEVFEIETEEFAEIEDINTKEITKHLCDVVYNCGVLVNLILDSQSESIIGSVKTKILKDLNAINRLNKALFMN